MKALSLDRLRPAPEGRASLSNIFLVWGAVAAGAAWLASILAVFIYPVGMLAIAYGFILRPTRRRFAATLLALLVAHWILLHALIQGWTGSP